MTPTALDEIDTELEARAPALSHCHFIAKAGSDPGARVSSVGPQGQRHECPSAAAFGACSCRDHASSAPRQQQVSPCTSDWDAAGRPGAGWSAGRYFHRAPAPAQELNQGVNFDTVVDQIIKVESNGDPNLKNKRSSATGSGQFLDETWLLLMRAHRPDLVRELHRS